MVIREYMRAHGRDKVIIRDGKGRRRKIRTSLILLVWNKDENENEFFFLKHVKPRLIVVGDNVKSTVVSLSSRVSLLCTRKLHRDLGERQKGPVERRK